MNVLKLATAISLGLMCNLLAQVQPHNTQANNNFIFEYPDYRADLNSLAFYYRYISTDI